MSSRSGFDHPRVLRGDVSASAIILSLKDLKSAWARRAFCSGPQILITYIISGRVICGGEDLVERHVFGLDFVFVGDAHEVFVPTSKETAIKVLLLRFRCKDWHFEHR